MKDFKNSRGVALMLALVVFGVVSVLAVSLATIVSHQARMELRAVDGTVLFYGAEAGIEEAKYRVKNNVPTNWLVNGAYISEHDIGETKVTVAVTGPVTYPDGDFYTVTSTARWLHSDLTRTISIKARSPAGGSMSKYMFFINNAHLNIGSGAEVWGEVHSNKNIKIFGGGVIFHDKVTAVNKILFYNGATSGNTSFLGAPAPGYWEGVDVVPMPDVSALENLAVWAENDPNGNYHYTNNISLELLDTGDVIINGVIPAVPLPSDGVIFCDKNINISGTLNGELTVVSMQTINITDNLVYDPLTPLTNVLGLIADKHIYVPDSAPHDLEINAAMIARTGKAYCALSQAKGQLIIRGSLCTSQLSYFASTSGHGYTDRDYHYDDNLLALIPPHYLTILDEDLFKDWRDEGE